MNKQLVLIQSDIYIPSFNENTDKYIDKSPYKLYERNCIRYECRCRAGAFFIGNTLFKQHIKSKTHKEFIKNYKKYYKEIDNSSKIINELKIENEFLTRKNKKLQKEIDKLENDEFHDCINN